MARKDDEEDIDEDETGDEEESEDEDKKIEFEEDLPRKGKRTSMQEQVDKKSFTKHIAVPEKTEKLRWQPYIRGATYGIINTATQEFIGADDPIQALLIIASRTLSYAEESAKNTR